MKLWRVQSSGVAPPAAPIQAEAKQEVDPLHQDRRIGVLEAIGLSTGIACKLESNVPPRHFAWLFQIRQLQPVMRGLGDEALNARWAEIRARVAGGTPVRDVVPEAFAVMREISRRTIGEEPYEVQLLTAMGLLTGRIVQMRTGEGKSLAIVLAASLAALEGKGVHVIAESTDSAERDSQRYRKLYRALGLEVGLIKDAHQYDPNTIQKEKRAAYAADVTYGFADNFIFDRLQDATWTEARMRVQRPLAWAMVDEADNVLLDIAQQPVILTETASEPHPAWAADLKLADRIVRDLIPGKHFEVRTENAKKTASLTDAGFDVVEAALRAAGRSLPKEGLAHPTQYPFFHALRQTLAAHSGALESGKHYIGEGVLVNQHNGRAQPLSRFFHGASDAVAVAQGRPIENQTIVVGQTSYQDFFSLYPHLSGVSGTIEGTHHELLSVYGLRTMEVPTRLPSKLSIEPEEVYINEYLDRAASVAKVLEAHHQNDRPVLFPAVTVAQSKMLHERLRDPLLALADVATSSLGLLLAACERLEDGASIREKWLGKDLEQGRDEARADVLALLRKDQAGRERFVDFLEEHDFPARPLLGPPAQPSLVNAENGDHLAVYVARAGKPKALTVTTLMGRATDVRPKHEEGLLVICYGHRSSRRDDLQVAGRAGRQGMPGTVQFFTSLNDETLSGFPAKMLRRLRESLTSYDRLRPTKRQRAKVQRAIRYAQERIGAEAELGRMQRAKLDRIVAEKRRSLDVERAEILERGDLPEVMESWVHFEVGRELIRREMLADVDRMPRAKLESFAKRELNEAWILTGHEAAAILKEAGVPPISDDLDAQIPLETLFEHAGVDPSFRKNLTATPTGLALCRATARWKASFDADGLSHEEISRMLVQDAGTKLDRSTLQSVLDRLGIPIAIDRDVHVGELGDVLHDGLKGLMERAQLGLVEDKPSRTMNQHVRDLLLSNLNRIFCDFLEREQLHQENLAHLAAYGQRDPMVEYWKRASEEFDRMQARVQRTTATEFLAEMKRLAPLAVSQEVPESLDAAARAELEFFCASLDALTFNLDPHQFASSNVEEMARAFVDGLPKSAARWFGPLLHPVLELVRDHQVGLVPREELHRALLELRLAMLEQIEGWPEETKKVVLAGLSKHLPRLDPSPSLANPSPEALRARLTIDEMAPLSVRKREAGLRDDGSKLLLEEFLLGRVKAAGHPLISRAIDLFSKEGGAIYALAAQDRERRNWLEHRAPPFFVSENGQPYIAIDLLRDGAIEALAHELRHFERWRERRDRLVKEGMPAAKAAQRALEIENLPENLIQGETECVQAELAIQAQGNSGWNVSGRPTEPHEPGYISRMAYPRIQGLRMYLWNEKQGQTIDIERCRTLIRELIDLASDARKMRAQRIEAEITREQDPTRLLRLRVQEKVLASRSLFDDIFNERDLDLFRTNETEERLLDLWRSVAGENAAS